jgi:hypothetical protein
MLAEKITKPTNKQPVQQKTVNSGKSLPSAPVAQLFRNEMESPTFEQKEYKVASETGVKQLKSAPSFPPIQLMSNSSKGVVQKVDDFEMDKVFDGPKSTFQQENPMLVAKRAAAEKAAFRVKPDNLDDITFDKVHGMGKSSDFKQENPMLAGKKASPIAAAAPITDAATVVDRSNHDGLYSIKDDKRHDLFTKASKVLTGNVDANTFHEDNPAYGKSNKPFDRLGDKPYDPKAEKPIGRLAPMYIHQPKDGLMKRAFHVAATERGAKSAAAQIDAGWHNESGRFGGGFHVASDIATGAMEVDHHKLDAKKKAKQDALEDGKSPYEMDMAYAKADLVQPTNYLPYDVNLGAGDIVDATGPLTALVMSRPKEIELAARQDNKDGILYKSSRGSGFALVLYKNYTSILKLLNPKSTTDPAKFGEKHVFKREKMRNAEADEEEIAGNINPTNKISNFLNDANKH